MPKRIEELRHVVLLYAIILVVWGFYRFLFKLPDQIEEVVLKPIIWLLPLVFLLGAEGVSTFKAGLSSLGWRRENFFKSIYIALGLGVLFVALGILTNSIKYGGQINFAKLDFVGIAFWVGIFTSFVTSVSEETAFRGFIFQKLWKAFGNEWISNILTTMGWAIVHIPVTIFVLRLDFLEIITFLFLVSVFGFGSAFLFARTGNIASSILLHVFWEWPIILFR